MSITVNHGFCFKIELQSQGEFLATIRMRKPTIHVVMQECIFFAYTIKPGPTIRMTFIIVDLQIPIGVLINTCTGTSTIAVMGVSDIVLIAHENVCIQSIHTLIIQIL